MAQLNNKNKHKIMCMVSLFLVGEKKILCAHRYSITVVSIYKITETENYIYIVRLPKSLWNTLKVFSY